MDPKRPQRVQRQRTDQRSGASGVRYGAHREPLHPLGCGFDLARHPALRSNDGRAEAPEDDRVSSDKERRQALREALRLTTKAEELVNAGAPGAEELLGKAKVAIAKSTSSHPPPAPPVTGRRALAVQYFRNLLKQRG